MIKTHADQTQPFIISLIHWWCFFPCSLAHLLRAVLFKLAKPHVLLLFPVPSFIIKLNHYLSCSVFVWFSSSGISVQNLSTALLELVEERLKHRCHHSIIKTITTFVKICLWLLPAKLQPYFRHPCNFLPHFWVSAYLGILCHSWYSLYPKIWFCRS